MEVLGVQGVLGWGTVVVAAEEDWAGAGMVEETEAVVMAAGMAVAPLEDREAAWTVEATVAEMVEEAMEEVVTAGATEVVGQEVEKAVVKLGAA